MADFRLDRYCMWAAALGEGWKAGNKDCSCRRSVVDLSADLKADNKGYS